MNVLTHISLNFQQPNYLTVYAAQNDRLSRYINAQLLDGSAPWTLPTGGLMTIRYRKPDGTSGFYDTLEDGSPAYNVETDGSITFGLAEQALTVPGAVPVELNFYNAAGSKLSTLTFIVAVKPSAYSDEDIESSDYYNILTAKMQQLAELSDQAEGDYQDYLSALSAFVGAPRTAPTAADMLDTNLVYVYTGSETGYTYGDWYYYNGREWVSGGVYNSAAISLDATLTNADKPAQAKAAGDLVLVQDTQPSAPVNKLWFPLTDPVDEQVPTWDEFSELKSSLNSKAAEPSGAKAAGKIYGLDSSLNPVWTDAGESTEKTLDSIAWGNKTYRDIFVTGNKLPYGDFESGLSFADAITNSPIISEDACVSKSHSLKCFGSSSKQIKVNTERLYTTGGSYYTAVKVNCLRWSNGNVGLQTPYFSVGGGAKNISVSETTDGFVTLSDLKTNVNATAGTGLFIGTFSSANADAYVDDVMVIDMIATFGAEYPDKETLDSLYDEYLALRNSSVPGEILVGAIMDATSESDRFLAMKEIFDIAVKRLKSPSYTPQASEFTHASKGIVCILPEYPSMFERYSFDSLFEKDAAVQSIPASTTKVMAAVTGLPFVASIKDKYTIVADDVESGSGNYFDAGDVLTIEDVLFGMMLPSSNTCAKAFAHYCGSKILGDSATASACVAAFVSEMNKKAELIGCGNSTFTTPSGYDTNNVSTVRDLLRITVEAASFPELNRIWNKKNYSISVGGTNPRTVSLATTVTNDTFEASYYIFGGKTGHITGSADALVMIARQK